LQSSFRDESGLGIEIIVLVRLTASYIGRNKDIHYDSNRHYFLEQLQEVDEEEETVEGIEDDESTLVGSEEESSKYFLEWISLFTHLTLRRVHLCVQ
jgi:hypothetical protein